MSKPHEHFKEHNNLIGAFLVLTHALAIAVLYGVMKELRDELSANLIMFLYKFFILIIILPSCMRKGFKALRTKKLQLHVLRAILSLCGSLAFFYAIKFVELVDATAVGYLEQVLWAIIGMVYFAEKVTASKIISVILSFLGAILIVYSEVITFDQNGLQIILNSKVFHDFNYYYLFVFLSIILWATNCTIVKLLGNTESTQTQLFYVMMFSSLFAFPLAFFELRAGSEEHFFDWTIRCYSFAELGLKLEHISLILVLALCYFIHSITFFKALKLAELSAVVPFDYSRLVFTGLIGYIFFNETPKLGGIIGLLLIVVSGVYLVRAETYRIRTKAKQRELQIEYENA